MLTMSAEPRAERCAAERHPAWNQCPARWARRRREVGRGKGSRDWPARRDRAETNDGLTVVVDLATYSAIAAEEMNRRQRSRFLESSEAIRQPTLTD